MNTQPPQPAPKPAAKQRRQGPAWVKDDFWREVVMILAKGKKLNGRHYLQGLSAGELRHLRMEVPFCGTLEEQQQRCPKRRGGRWNGNLPSIRLLSVIGRAVREVTVLRDLQRKELIEAGMKERCGQLGLSPELTDAVLRVVADEVLSQKAKDQVGPFAIAAGNMLLHAESSRTHSKQEERLIDLKEAAEKRQASKLGLDERRIVLMEKKAAAYDRAQAALEESKKSRDGITSETWEKIERELKLL